MYLQNAEASGIFIQNPWIHPPQHAKVLAEKILSIQHLHNNLSSMENFSNLMIFKDSGVMKTESWHSYILFINVVGQRGLQI